MASRNGKKASVPPDLVGGAGRARMVAQKLAELQQLLFGVEVTRTVNGHGDGDRMPLAGAEAADWPTYAERRSELQAAIARLWDLEPGLEAQVRALVDAGDPSGEE